MCKVTDELKGTLNTSRLGRRACPRSSFSRKVARDAGLVSGAEVINEERGQALLPDL